MAFTITPNSAATVPEQCVQRSTGLAAVVPLGVRSGRPVRVSARARRTRYPLTVESRCSKSCAKWPPRRMGRIAAYQRASAQPMFVYVTCGTRFAIIVLMTAFRIWGSTVLVAVLVGCGGSEFSSSSDGAGGDSAGSGGTAAGGASSGGPTSAAGGTSSTGSGGDGSNVSNTSSGTTTTGSGTDGAGGNGGGGTDGGPTCTLSCERAVVNGERVCRCARDQEECEADTDCGLATNAGTCCSGCADAYPTDLIESEPCLLKPGESRSSSCEAPDCDHVQCPSIDCIAPVYAACEEKRCVPRYECPDGMVDSGGRCVPACTSHEDCVVAERVDTCCAACPSAEHRTVVEGEPCVVPYGEMPPPECTPDPKECALVLCPQVLCTAPGEAVCMENGRCAMRVGVPL